MPYLTHILINTYWKDWVQPTKPKWGNELPKARPALPTSLTWLESVHVVICMHVCSLCNSTWQVQPVQTSSSSKTSSSSTTVIASWLYTHVSCLLFECTDICDVYMCPRLIVAQ